MEKFTKPETGAISAMYHWLFISLSCCFLLTNVRSLRCILIYPLIYFVCTVVHYYLRLRTLAVRVYLARVYLTVAL